MSRNMIIVMRTTHEAFSTRFTTISVLFLVNSIHVLLQPTFGDARTLTMWTSKLPTTNTRRTISGNSRANCEVCTLLTVVRMSSLTADTRTLGGHLGTHKRYPISSFKNQVYVLKQSLQSALLFCLA